MDFLLIGLIGLVVLAIPFVAPFVSWVRISRLRDRIDELEREVQSQRDTIGKLKARVYSLAPEAATAPAAATPAPAAATERPPVPTPATVVPPPAPAPLPKPSSSPPP